MDSLELLINKFRSFEPFAISALGQLLHIAKSTCGLMQLNRTMGAWWSRLVRESDRSVCDCCIILLTQHSVVPNRRAKTRRAYTRARLSPSFSPLQPSPNLNAICEILRSGTYCSARTRLGKGTLFGLRGYGIRGTSWMVQLPKARVAGDAEH